SGGGLDALENGVGVDVGGVVVQQLGDEIRQAVAVHVDEVVVDSVLAPGRGTAAAEPVDAIGGADTDVGAGAAGRYLRPPHRAAAARRAPELRLAEAVAKVELGGDAAGRRLHQVRQAVAVHVDEVVG